MSSLGRLQVADTTAGRLPAPGAVVVAHACTTGGLRAGREAELLARLPAEMQARHARFVHQRDRDAYLVARLLLVELLGDPATPAACLTDWRRGARGKPALAAAVGSLDFSLSHSGGVVACALSAAGAVGLDVEWRRPVDLDAVRSFFSPVQWQAIAAAADPAAAFYELWTGVESVLKAAGVGLSRQPSTVALAGAAATLDGAEWHLQSLHLADGYSAHLACARRPTGVTLHELSF